MSPQEAGDELESILKFQVQIKEHYQRDGTVFTNTDP